MTSIVYEEATQKENIQDIELIDIEDIVPPSGNSMFLSIARTVLYLSNKNPTFLNALKSCCDIDINHNKSDIDLQSVLRAKLCDYFCTNGIVYDKERNYFHLRDEYSKLFNGNIYDFLVEVYQLSINNFSNNALYKKFALPSLSQILNLTIYYKKSNGQWKCFYPFINRHSEKTLKKLACQQFLDENKYKITSEKKKQMDYLNEHVIYLQEFRSDTLNKTSLCNPTKKVVRILMSKKLWLSKFTENLKICMNFSQFNDKQEYDKYQKLFFTIDSTKISDIFTKRSKSYEKTNQMNMAFCVFIQSVSVNIITNCINTNSLSNDQSELSIRNNQADNFELSQEYNTIGKQLKRFEAVGIQKVHQYINHLWKKVIFTDEFVSYKFSLLF